MLSQKWEDLSVCLSASIMKILKNTFRFTTMTPVQASCIPEFMNYKDVAVEAVTGSGKTIAFIVPLIEMIIRGCKNPKSGQIYGLIISPTRELAIQTKQVLDCFLKEFEGLNSQLLIGGTSLTSDLKKIIDGKINILVVTPGRFHDLISRSETSQHLRTALKFLEVLVLDEADRLLTLGFEKQITEIFSLCPKQRRTGLFSATQTADVKKLIRAGLRNPLSIVVREKDSVQRTPESLENKYVQCQPSEKPSVLLALLKEMMDSHQKVIVFFSTCAMVEFFSVVVKSVLKTLKKSTTPNILSIHGKMKSKRSGIFRRFGRLTSGVLLCTDVMARGVDIANVHWVLQYDPPSSAESFVHRCGRTARSGQTGAALLMLLPSELDYVQFLLINQRVSLTCRSVPHVPLLSEHLRRLQLEDRAVMDKANRAFVSFVQSYAKHECQLIFQLKELNLGALAQGLGLLRMPKMPELRGGQQSGDFVAADVDLNSVRYVDAEKERRRQLKLQTYRETGQWPGLRPAKAKPWSQSKEKRQLKKEKKRRRSAKRQANENKRKVEEEEWDEIADEARLIKKLKKGKISKAEFDKNIGIS